ncbi:MAG: hypothetical protein K2X87_22385 [Gemmataceae bacterium]|nr:hypothetical protein [Gemmataceae bacterium]
MLFRRPQPPTCPAPAFTLIPGDRLELLWVPPRWPFPSTPGLFLSACSAELTALVGWFGFPFDRPVRVYVWPTAAWLSAYYGVSAGGVALLAEPGIAVGGDLPDPRPMVRHELAHLFSGAWGSMNPPLKSEGLAVWWEHRSGDPAGHEDRVAAALRGQMAAGRPYRLADLLDPAVFWHPADKHACYALAGGFTRWLVGRFGWVRYRDFFRRATGANFGPAFADGFGLMLRDAERDWHRDVMATAPRPGRDGSGGGSVPPRRGARE